MRVAGIEVVARDYMPPGYIGVVVRSPHSALEDHYWMLTPDSHLLDLGSPSDIMPERAWKQWDREEIEVPS